MVPGAGNFCQPKQGRVGSFHPYKNFGLPSKIKGVELFMSELVKFLGVYLNRKLNRKTWMTSVKCAYVSATVIRVLPKIIRWIYSAIVQPMLCYDALVWWIQVHIGVARGMLTHVQRMACLILTGCIRTIHTATIEVLLGLTPVHLYILGEATSSAVSLCQSSRLGSLSDSAYSIFKSGTGQLPLFQ